MIRRVDRVRDSVAPPRAVGTANVLIPPTCSAQLRSLLEQASGGDKEAFAALYDATAARAYGISLHILHDSGPAAEVVQAAYVYIWTHSASFQPTQGSAISWILKVVHQRAVSRLRSGAPATVGDPCASTTTGPAPALVDVAATQRQAVELAYCQGYTHTEVDQLRELPLGTAQLQIRDGLLQLHDTMEPTAG